MYSHVYVDLVEPYVFFYFVACKPVVERNVGT